MEMGIAMQGMGWIRIFGTTSVTGSKTEQNRNSTASWEEIEGSDL
jgi:hypothetical protein